MNRLGQSFLIASLVVFSLPVLSQDYTVRELGRMQVTHCRSDIAVPPVVVVQDVETAEGFFKPGVEVKGDPIPADTDCILIDSYVNSGEIEGEIMITGQPIERILYSAAIRSGGRAYSIADWATTISHTSNGAQYTVASRMQQNEDGTALTYPISMLRRAPDEQIVEIDGTDCIVTNYDRSTIIRVQKNTPDGVVIFELDYRGRSN